MSTTLKDHPLPWPAPETRWLMRFTWSELLFIHYPVREQEIRPLIPDSLDVDTYDGDAWIGIVPFRMSDIRTAYLPPIYGLDAFPELNVRTYVTSEGKPGVWFFSLDAGSRIAVEAARKFFHLPYFDASMNVQINGKRVAYSSSRIDRRSDQADFQAVYEPSGDLFDPQDGSIEHWLTARYCLYAINQENGLYRGEIHHAPWRLQRAEAVIHENSLLAPLGLGPIENAPLLHYSESIDAVASKIQKVGSTSNLKENSE